MILILTRIKTKLRIRLKRTRTKTKTIPRVAISEAAELDFSTCQAGKLRTNKRI
jgi:hypothetical protein